MKVHFIQVFLHSFNLSLSKSPFCFLKEINLLWAEHQVHHSSEDLNISVSLRQSVVQQFVTWVSVSYMHTPRPPRVLSEGGYDLRPQEWHSLHVLFKGPLLLAEEPSFPQLPPKTK